MAWKKRIRFLQVFSFSFRDERSIWASMIVGFVIWSLVSVILLSIGIRTLKSNKAAGFFAGVEPPEVRDVRKYNRSVAVLWFVYAILFELLGLPLLFLKQNDPGFLGSILGVAMITIGLMAVYHRILAKYGQNTNGG